MEHAYFRGRRVISIRGFRTVLDYVFRRVVGGRRRERLGVDQAVLVPPTNFEDDIEFVGLK